MHAPARLCATIKIVSSRFRNGDARVLFKADPSGTVDATFGLLGISATVDNKARILVFT